MPWRGVLLAASLALNLVLLAWALLSMVEVGGLRAAIRDSRELSRLDDLSDPRRCRTREEVLAAAAQLGWTMEEHDPRDVPLPVGLDPDDIGTVLMVVAFADGRRPGTELQLYLEHADCPA